MNILLLYHQAVNSVTQNCAYDNEFNGNQTHICFYFVCNQRIHILNVFDKAKTLQYFINNTIIINKPVYLSYSISYLIFNFTSNSIYIQTKINICWNIRTPILNIIRINTFKLISYMFITT